MKDFHFPDDFDMGTPARHGPPVSLTIDGFAVTVPAGTSVMRAAAEAGIPVPKRPAGCAWWKSKAARARPRPAPRRSPRAWSCAPRPRS